MRTENGFLIAQWTEADLTSANIGSSPIQMCPPANIQTITNLVNIGQTCTATVANHGYFNGQNVQINVSGDQAFAGYYSINVLTANTFSYQSATAPTATFATATCATYKVRTALVYADPANSAAVQIGPNSTATARSLAAGQEYVIPSLPPVNDFGTKVDLATWYFQSTAVTQVIHILWLSIMLTLFFLTNSASAQGGYVGVQKLVAGTNISLSPVSGSGVVTINGSGGSLTTPVSIANGGTAATTTLGAGSNIGVMTFNQPYFYPAHGETGNYTGQLGETQSGWLFNWNGANWYQPFTFLGVPAFGDQTNMASTTNAHFDGRVLWNFEGFTNSSGGDTNWLYSLGGPEIINWCPWGPGSGMWFPQVTINAGATGGAHITDSFAGFIGVPPKTAVPPSGSNWNGFFGGHSYMVICPDTGFDAAIVSPVGFVNEDASVAPKFHAAWISDFANYGWRTPYAVSNGITPFEPGYQDLIYVNGLTGAILMTNIHSTNFTHSITNSADIGIAGNLIVAGNSTLKGQITGTGWSVDSVGNLGVASLSFGTTVSLVGISAGKLRIDDFTSGSDFSQISFGAASSSTGAGMFFAKNPATITLQASDGAGVENLIVTGTVTTTNLTVTSNAVFAQGLKSSATNTYTMGSTGYTNTGNKAIRLIEFTGVSVTQSNSVSKTSISLGTISTGYDKILQPNESVVGSTCAVSGMVDF